jgi:hypothetical protein
MKKSIIDKSQQNSNLFGIQRLLRMGISLENAQKINNIVQYDVISNEINNKDKENNDSNNNDDVKRKQKEIQDNEIHKYLEFKQYLYDEMKKIIISYDKQFIGYRSKALEDIDILFEFSKIHKKLLNDNIQINFDSNYLRNLDFHISKYFSAGIYQLIYEFQRYKERVSYLFGFKQLYTTLKYLRKKIILNELHNMENKQKCKAIKLFEFLHRMSKYLLFNLYHDLGMNCYKIKYIETCYITVRLVEYILGSINAYMIFKNVEEFVECRFNEDVDFPDDPYEDEQIKQLVGYNEILSDYLVDLF